MSPPAFADPARLDDEMLVLGPCLLPRGDPYVIAARIWDVLGAGLVVVP